MDIFDAQIERLRERFTGPELDARIRAVHARRAQAHDNNARFEAALAEVMAEAGPEPVDELPFDRQYRMSRMRSQARLRAGLLTLDQYRVRIARITTTRDDRARAWNAFEDRRATTPTKLTKVAARLAFRAARPRGPVTVSSPSEGPITMKHTIQAVEVYAESLPLGEYHHARHELDRACYVAKTKDTGGYEGHPEARAFYTHSAAMLREIADQPRTPAEVAAAMQALASFVLA